MEEIWKDIEGYEGLYQVSNLGRVKSLGREIIRKDGNRYTSKEKIMKPSYDLGGYQILTLYKNKKGITKIIHRLVAISFIPNKECKPQVNHKNGVKTDNKVSNLEWSTSSENINHAYINDLSKKGVEVYNSKLLESEVKLIKYDLIGLSQRKIAKMFNISQTWVSKIRLGKVWKHI